MALEGGDCPHFKLVGGTRAPGAPCFHHLAMHYSDMKNIVIRQKELYILFFFSVFLPVPMESQNKICTAYSRGSSR